MYVKVYKVVKHQMYYNLKRDYAQCLSQEFLNFLKFINIPGFFPIQNIISIN